MIEITLPPICVPSRLPELIRRCKASVTIEVNDHRSCYQSVEQFMEEEDEPIEADVLQKMIETDTIVRLQFYPLTPIGFYVIFHYDVERAIEQALAILNKHHDQSK